MLGIKDKELENIIFIDLVGIYLLIGTSEKIFCYDLIEDSVVKSY